jgi:O-antigen/teichoic acid export membrane protein
MTSLRARLAVGAQWTISIRVVDRVIGFATTLILARLLVPADFGVVAMGTASRNSGVLY